MSMVEGLVPIFVSIWSKRWTLFIPMIILSISICTNSLVSLHSYQFCALPHCYTLICFAFLPDVFVAVLVIFVVAFANFAEPSVFFLGRVTCNQCWNINIPLIVLTICRNWFSSLSWKKVRVFFDTWEPEKHIP